MIKVKIKSKYIHYGRQVQNQEISVTKDELAMFDRIGVQYEILKEEKKKKDAAED